MIIYFMQKWPDGSPTYFREKILRGITNVPGEFMPDLAPKFHTMRESFRCRAGMKLDLAYWSGKPYNSSPDRFVSQMPCISTQKVEIIHNTATGLDISGHMVNVLVDGEYLGFKEIEVLAKNDGFDSIIEFFKHFNKTATYNLIHWTNLTY